MGDGYGIDMVDSSNGSSKGLLKQSELERLLGNTDMPNIAKELVHPGVDPRELMMRTYFKTEKELNATVNYLSKCIEFEDKEGQNVLIMKLAGKVSINGLSRDQLVQVMVGQLYRIKPDIGDKNKKDQQKDEL